MLPSSYPSVSTVLTFTTYTFDKMNIFPMRRTLTKRTGLHRTTVFSLKLYWGSSSHQRQSGRIAPESLAVMAMLLIVAGRHYCSMAVLV
jgi:hypothetical protein